MSGLQAVVFDIEGTTTSISFVYETLFPYARWALAPFLQAHWDDPAVRADAQTMGLADDAGPEAAAARAFALMDGDVKDTGLKALQGRVWAEGYASGVLLGHVYDEIPEVFATLAARGLTLAIYSSGSIAAQKLIFGHSVAGDLTGTIAAYFDTTTGPKKAPESYAAIARELGFSPGAIAFVTDSLDEARAAKAAGWAVWVSARPGNPVLPEDHGFPVVSDFRILAASL